MVSLSYWLAASLAASVCGFHLQHKPRLQPSLPPSQDAFYAVPEDIGRFSPGEIINHREPPSPITAYEWVPAHVEKAYQILYRTTDSREQPTATVLTVLIPPDADYNKLLSLQMAEDSATIDCSPSYSIQREAQSNPLLRSTLIELQLLLAEAVLVQKAIVIVPDFEGPEASFTASKITSHAILDGIRAATRSGHITGIGSKPRIALWGYSGGASATHAAVTMQELYAPELEVVGAAMGGLPALEDPIGIFNLNKGPSAALIPSALIGLATQHPDLKKSIDQSLKDEHRDLFYSPLHRCLQPSAVVLANQDILAMFKDESIPQLTAELVKAFHKENDMPPTAIKAPLYVYQSVIDHISDVQKIDVMVRDYCEQGVSVHYERANSTNLSHVKYGIIGAPKAISWIQDRLDGKEAPRGCVNLTDTTSTLDPNFASLFPKNISDAVIRTISGP
ncbi:secretory lipase family [Trichoderma cornu-damae]|uniref:Secretory lipase family n=1 Tax=Trichoderma cornu-damae TaxID=654480 RepID=A0A9P8TUD3_9HYPO|nr:secretory lipase family [Trichoderma cornu-damae]